MCQGVARVSSFCLRRRRLRWLRRARRVIPFEARRMVDDFKIEFTPTSL